MGTPFYVYSHATLERHFLVFDRAFARIPHMTCYSCKANTNIAHLKLMARLGGGADIVSGGELNAALGIVPAEKIVFSGVGKTDEEIDYAIESGIAMINIESEGESGRRRRARKMGKDDARIHKGEPGNRRKDAPLHHHGPQEEQVRRPLAGSAAPLPGNQADGYLVPVGISSHIGSQISEIPPFVEAIRSLKRMVADLRSPGSP